MKEKHGEPKAVQMVIQSIDRARVTLNDVSWQQQPAANVNTLEAVSGIRFGLSYAAEHICPMIRKLMSPGQQQQQLQQQQQQQQQQQAEDRDSAHAGGRKLRIAVYNLIHTIQGLCNDCDGTASTIRIFLIKQIVRSIGLDTFREAMDNDATKPEFGWIMPDRLRTMAGEEVVPDRFIVHGDAYVKTREATAGVALNTDIAQLTTAVACSSRVKRINAVELVLALYREVTMCHAESEDSHPQLPNATQKLHEFIQQTELLSHGGKELAALLIDNTQGAGLQAMRVQPAQSGNVRSLSALVVHFVTVLQECSQRNRVLEVFHRLAFNPTAMRAAFLPTMPEDHLQEARAAIGGAWYECPNGHPYYISECGQPIQDYTCPDCGQRIGGGQNCLINTNRQARTGDATQTGHLLGRAQGRSTAAVPERELGPAMTVLTRLLMHLTLVWSSSCGTPQQLASLSDMCKPQVPVQRVAEFFWAHLDMDIRCFAQAIGKELDQTLLALHFFCAQICKKCKSNQAGNLDFALPSRIARANWERAFHQDFLAAFQKAMEEGVRDGMQRLTGDHRLGNDQLLKAVSGVDSATPVLELAAHERHLTPRLWRYRVRPSIDGLAVQLVSRKDEFPLLHAFLEHEHQLKALKHLPEIVQLQRQLIDRFSRRINRKTAKELTITTYIKELGEVERERAAEMISAYEDAWMLVSTALMMMMIVSAQWLLQYLCM